MTSVLLHLQGNHQESVTGQHVPNPYQFPKVTTVAADPYTGTSSLQLNGLFNEAVSTQEKAAFTFTGDFTIELFFKPKYKQVAYLFNLGGCNSLNWGSQTCYIVADGNVIYNIATEASGWSVFNEAPVGQYIVDQWNHLAIVRSGTAYKIYLNGVLTGSGTNSKPPKVPPYRTSIGNFPFANDTDFSGLQSFAGKIDNFRVTKNVARYTGTSFAVPTVAFGRTVATDSHWNNVSMLLDMESSADGIPTDPDHSGIVWSRSTPVNKSVGWSSSGAKFGTFSAVPNGAVTYPPTTMYDAAIGTADFTWELWYRPAFTYNPGQYQTLISSRPSGSFGETSSIALGLSGQAVYVYADKFLIEQGAVTVGQWNHIALVRKDGVISVYINGGLIASYSASVIDLKRSQIVIGANADGGGIIFDTGAKMCEVRLSNVARYSGTFIPPTAPFEVD